MAGRADPTRVNKRAQERQTVIIWRRVSKGDDRTIPIADRHYTRQSAGSRRWTRPGYNMVLLAEFPEGRGLFCWWRPKWEDGRPGTARADGRKVIECTMFRREGQTPIASEMIRAAVDQLSTPWANCDLRLTNSGPIDALITGVNSRLTRRRRSGSSLPGKCFLEAGWTRISGMTTTRADVWLTHPVPEAIR